MSFTNLYYKRTAATPKACYICFRPTPTVLATAQSVDFFYTCDGHLTDPGFATKIGETGDGASGARKLGLSEEEIEKVKKEWEERQKRKKEKEKEKAEQEKGKEEGKDKDKEAESKTKETASKQELSIPTPSPQPTPSSMPTHQRYTLHRDIFAMRLTIHRKRRQTEQAKKIAPTLPSAPHIPLPRDTANS